MSAAHDAHADASAGHHDAHDHFDNEPATELGADEPRTPAWVPYLGLALFFAAGVACLLCADEDKPANEKPVAAAAEAAPAPVAPPRPQVLPKPGAQPALPMPGQPGQPGAPNVPNALKQLTPEQARELQKRLQGLQNKGANPVPPAGGAPQPGAVPQPPPQPNLAH